jgi:hypothetical protein
VRFLLIIGTAGLSKQAMAYGKNPSLPEPPKFEAIDSLLRQMDRRFQVFFQVKQNDDPNLGQESDAHVDQSIRGVM